MCPCKEGRGKSLALLVLFVVEKMSRMLEKKMDLPKDMVFYALMQRDRLHSTGYRIFLFAFPSDMGSKTLKEAVNEMLLKQEGMVRYDFLWQEKRGLQEVTVDGLGICHGYRRGGFRERQHASYSFRIGEGDRHDTRVR